VCTQGTNCRKRLAQACAFADCIWKQGVAVCRFILLEADGEMSPWSRLCVSQADCVLLVAAPDASPEVLKRRFCSPLLWPLLPAVVSGCCTQMHMQSGTQHLRACYEPGI
jgi:hypothetical protein